MTKVRAELLSFPSFFAPNFFIRFEKRLAQLHGLYSDMVPAHNALAQHFQHLPAGRQELLEELQHQ